MSSTENHEKIDELLGKIKTLGSRAKEVRSSFGSPIMDTILNRANRTLSKLGNGNGVRQEQPQPQPPGRICPKCGVPALQEARFCSRCAFDFEAQESSERRRREEEERLERFSKMGVIP